MALTAQQKKDAIKAKRGPLLHEQYAAELDVATAKESGDESLVQEPEARLKRVNDQLKALDKEEAKIKD